MKHIELHVIDNVLDAALAGIAGLPQIDGAKACASCSRLVGYIGANTFVPTVIAMTDAASGFYCPTCAGESVRMT